VETATFILLGAFLGMIGGMLQLLTTKKQSWLSITVNLIAGCVAGAITGIILCGEEPSKLLLIAIIFIGYVWADFILFLLGR
jgi:hypothetical protein